MNPPFREWRLAASIRRADLRGVRVTLDRLSDNVKRVRPLGGNGLVSKASSDHQKYDSDSEFCRRMAGMCLP
jgi:hypothetical protein